MRSVLVGAITGERYVRSFTERVTFIIVIVTASKARSPVRSVRSLLVVMHFVTFVASCS